jgi:protein-S-isoprenylcysteine O-methyltransferase Ste14
MEVIMQILNGIFTAMLFLGYLILWFIKRKELLKTAGVDANVIFKSTRPIQKYFGKLEKIMTISIVVIILVHLFFKDRSAYTHYINMMDTLLIKVIGFIAGISGLVLCRIAQITIGKSWRVGIDEDAKPGLIIKGIYKYMRNPTYTGLFVLCAGVWIINPTFLFSFWILAFYIMMEFQVRCEEEYLESVYGKEYLEYCQKTKRYFPLVY